MKKFFEKFKDSFLKIGKKRYEQGKGIPFVVIELLSWVEVIEKLFKRVCEIDYFPCSFFYYSVLIY